MLDYARARKAMIDGQLTPNKVVSKPVLASFSSTPREIFVATVHKESAYVDSFINVSAERKMMPPLVCARLVQGLDPQNTDKVLVLAAGTGYSAAVLSGVTEKVCAVEEDVSLLEQARRSFMDMKCKNVSLHEGRPELGFAAQSPFDKILIDAPVEFIPNQVWNQLKDGGKLATIQYKSEGISEAMVYTKKGNRLEAESLFETGGVVLGNFKQPKSFTF